MPSRRQKRVGQKTRAHAAQLRRDATAPERLLWSVLRGRGLGGFKFRRQHPVGRFIADFACVDLKVVVEIDGDTHNPEDDKRRDRWMTSQGWRVLRYTNQEVDDGLDWILRHIHEALAQRRSARPRRRDS